MKFFEKKKERNLIYFFLFFWFLTMEGREGVSSSGVTVVGSDAPSDYHVAPRSDNPVQTAGSAPQPAVLVPPPAAAAMTLPVKKKRGRPRKYRPDGSVAMALSPKPISSSAPPPIIDFSAEKRGSGGGGGGKARPPSSVNKTKYELENLGNEKIMSFVMYPFEF